MDKTSCLEGEFHLSIFQLEFLNYLNFSNNNFKSIHSSMDCQNLSLVNTLPHRSVNTSNLAYLDLSNNENLVINDMRWLLRLSPLEYLNLNHIDLHKQTHWLRIMTLIPSLSELHLSGCLLESASPSLEYVNFTSLKHLYLDDNDFFSELPKWLFNLSDLSFISLSGNRFHGEIPNTLLNLQKLESLYLGSNKLMSGAIPDWLGQFESMQHLYLQDNLFTGPIPITLGNLSSLIGLDISSNQLNDSLPESLGQLSNLIELRIAKNSLSGLVSHRNFANLSKLEILSLSSPSFLFRFNPHWIPPFQLEEIYLGYAKLKHIPWLYTQTSLISLWVHKSSFESVSPFEFWSWTTHTVYLYLKNNSMNWDMSNVLLNSEFIYLRCNGLRGGLPELTSKVLAFNIAENSMSGPLSPLLCHKMNGGNNLHYLDLFSNLLSGGLTNCWEDWKSLIHVSLGKNSLTGMIPHSMGTLTNIVSLHLQDNNLYGEISGFLRNCQKLVFLDLGGNKFYGKIPNWIGEDVNMKALKLRSNELSGDIPLQICKLSSLIVLDLANNRLLGTIPHCLDNITAMVFQNASTWYNLRFNSKFSVTYYFDLSLLTKGNTLNYYKNYVRDIDLSSNNLSGKIPSQVFSLISLQSLNLSNNQLMGIIPEEIGNIIKLESLDFSNNEFSGEIPHSMSALSFLEVLNLSFNNLRGQIPLGTQLQSFSPLSYEGNPKLCGTPLVTKCTNDKAPEDKKVVGNDEKKVDELLEGLYMGMGVGFATSFWIVCGSIFFVRRWRHAYFKFLGDMKDRVYVKVILWCTTRMET